MQAALAKIKGAFALAVMLQEAPDQLFVARNASPLAIGIEDGLICVASDAMAMAHLTRNVIYLKDGDYAALGVDDVQIYDRDGQRANREVIRTTASPALIDKGGFRHFMEKEIHEQPEAIAHTISAMTAADGALRSTTYNLVFIFLKTHTCIKLKDTDILQFFSPLSVFMFRSTPCGNHDGKNIIRPSAGS